MNSAITPNHPPYPAYRASEIGSFAHDSTVRRWPIIIETTLADIRQVADGATDPQQKQLALGIADAFEDLKKEIASDAKLRLLRDNDSDVQTWNAHITKYFEGTTWFNGSWLFNECYMYRRMRETVSMTPGWTDYDIFNSQKLNTFRGSHASVFDLAVNMDTMLKSLPIDGQELVFYELLQVCLWGNATDLSLLTNMTEEDIRQLQATGQEKLKEQMQRIVVNNIDQVWAQLKDLKHGRIDFVLDNSGFEVFVDLVLADWLLHTERAAKVVLHCKTIPWFVSDVMPKDVPLTFESCLDRDFFPGSHSEQERAALEKMVQRWQGYVASGKLVVQSHSFWCTGLAYRYLESEAPELFADMAQSDLVIFKGDLNYRKLVFDCDWPVTTPFREAIGESLATRFTNILSLRTNKAETIVGLAAGKREEIEATVSANDWRCSGKYAIVSYNACPK
ncbi:hypothetical protein BC940DRAFT_127964 [Gongronella butleri]|nr:hypothetical protein BC940DRAFT_127964 [Gongronella butleri]